MTLEIDDEKFKLGMWSGFIGGGMLILAALFGIFDFNYLTKIGLVFIIPYILTFTWGVVAITGSICLYFENLEGDYLLIISGILSIVGMFLPIYTFNLEAENLIIYLSYHFGYIDPFLVLLGGTIDLLVRKEIILK
jgi:uncharacterized membrane protein